MLNEIKPLRDNMREVVVTFEGEENFIVPKAGGFGQEDNDGFVMVAGKSEVDGGATPKFESTPAPAPRPLSTTSTPRPASGVASTNVGTSNVPRPSGVSSGSIPRPASGVSSTNVGTSNVPRPSGVASTSTPLPKIPNFNSLGRDDLHAQVISLGRLKTQTSVYTPSQIQVITNAYNQALALYNQKFGTAPKPTTPTTPLPTFPNIQSMSCDGLNAEITRLEGVIKTSKFSSFAVADAYNKQLASAKSLKTSKCIVTPKPSPTLPTFPNFATLSCDNLKAEITKIKNTMATSRFSSAEITNAYTKALATANQELLKKNCGTPSPTPKPDPMPTPVPEVPKKGEEPPAPVGGGGGGAIGGGGGGGAMEETPTEEVPQGEVPQEEQKPNYSWLWILLLVGGVYMLTRKGNKN